ncbi:MAG: hypothetical protein F2664_08815 [Actinobacteria bacterium]|uniref:Unannotated protein n=1 Tax=freshwater metagenome TaxID=449393 RepID=A0A6J6NZ36_9ZZZZ|nr:hypothetical protein [Actinomycetota bacterium]MSY88413.1 hypothetical protein [Actinomycetota bacterium]MTA51227.1 hypothetical protein [Actinomycetota bacterium]
MKWILGVLSGLLLFSVLAQNQTIGDLRAQLKDAKAASAVPAPAPDATAVDPAVDPAPEPSTDPGSTPSLTPDATTPDATTPATSATASPTASATTTQTRPTPKTVWSGDTSQCNKFDQSSEWWQYTHAYLSDPKKYSAYKIWFLNSQSYVNTFAYCFDKGFVNKVNEIASTIP